MWCHVRHLNLVGKNPQRITKEDNEVVNKLYYEGINFPVSSKYYCRIEMQSKVFIHVFFYDNKLTYPVYLSNQKFNKFREDCLVINGKQSVKLESGFVSFKTYIKQISVPFKV